MRDSALILLTLNEIQGLETLWDQLPIGEFREVVGLDGGSTDGTQEFLRAKGIPVVVQPIRGRGVAFRCAAEACSSLTYTAHSAAACCDTPSLSTRCAMSCT